LLLETFALDGTLIVGAAVDVLLGAALFVLVAGPVYKRAGYAVAAMALLAFAATTFHVDLRRSSSGVFRTAGARLGPQNNIIFHRDGKTATVDVLDTEGNRSIRTNGKPDAALMMDPQGAPTGDEYTMAMLAMLPLGHRPDAKRAAVIGFGSGMSTTFLLASPVLEKVETIEIEPAIIEGARHFMPIVTPAFNDPRSQIVIDDAKSYFARGRNRYDIIVSEPSNPWVSGVASLFTEEFYARLAQYMNDGAVLSQWLHTYEIDAATVGSILKAMSKTFPDYVVYSTIDADVVIVARKGGPAGRFQPVVYEWPKMREMAERLKLDQVAIERRMIGSWRALEPYFLTYGVAANSDFFPVVDHRASKTRFTSERARMFTELQLSPIPVLEMLDSAPRGDRDRGEAPRSTAIESSRQFAWAAHDIVMTGTDAPFDSQGGRNGAAFMVHSWATTCRANYPFAEVLPYLDFLSETANPHLPPAAASEMWSWIANSPCGKRLGAAERSWIDLFGAIGRRDPRAMVASGRAVLKAARPPATAPSETAVLAVGVGYLCQGQRKEADAALAEYARRFIRRNERETELRYLFGLTNDAIRSRPPDGPCTVTAATPPAAAITWPATRSR